MNLIDQISPIAAGGACFIDRTEARGRFIDTGVDNDQWMPYGRICLAENTVENMARLLGWAPAAEVEAALEEIAALRAQLDSTTAKADRYAEVIGFLGEAAAELDKGDAA